MIKIRPKNLTQKCKNVFCDTTFSYKANKMYCKICAKAYHEGYLTALKNTTNRHNSLLKEKKLKIENYKLINIQGGLDESK